MILQILLLAASLTLPAPQLFAPSILIDNDSSPTFSPDGKTLLFAQAGRNTDAIVESHLVDGVWTKPQTASFSKFNDQAPAFSSDGSYVIFVSSRTDAATGKRQAHLYRVDRTADGWSEPVELPATVNIGPAIYAPSIAADGSIYFLGITRNGDDRVFQLYRSRFSGGTYQRAEPLPFSTAQTRDVDPDIAPDQSFIIFASSGRNGASDTKEHLFIVFARNGGWSDVQPLRYQGDDADGGSTDNSPILGRDGKTLFFSSDRGGDSHAYTLSIDKVLGG